MSGDGYKIILWSSSCIRFPWYGWSLPSWLVCLTWTEDRESKTITWYIWCWSFTKLGLSWWMESGFPLLTRKSHRTRTCARNRFFWRKFDSLSSIWRCLPVLLSPSQDEFQSIWQELPWYPSWSTLSISWILCLARYSSMSFTWSSCSWVIELLWCSFILL